MSDLDETFKRLISYKGVKGLMAMTSAGIVIRSSFPNESPETIQNYAAQFSALAAKSKEVIRGIDPTNEVTFIRVRSHKHEIMIAPHGDNILIVQQGSAENCKT